MTQPHIVILGAGYAGVRAARRLLQGLGRDARVSLISDDPYHTLKTGLHGAASGRITEEALRIPLRHIFRNHAIGLIRDRIGGIRLDEQELVGEQGTYRYDYLILAPGARGKTCLEGEKGSGIALDSLRSAASIRRLVREKPDASIVLCGAGPSGTELAADLARMAPQARITLADSHSEILPHLDADLRRHAAKKLRRMNVALSTGTRVAEGFGKAIELRGKDRRETVLPDLLVETAGSVPRWPGEFTVEGEEVPGMDDCLHLAGYPQVYVTGDAADLDHNVENALQSADAAAANILRSLRGEEPVPFAPKRRGLLLSLGPDDGVATTKVPLKGLPAIFLKFLVELWYVLSVGGPAPALRYARAHVMLPARARALWDGLRASRANRIWLLPLRLYLGALWFGEGYKKLIGPSQYASPRNFWDLVRIGPDSWIRSGNLQIPFPWLGADAVSSATMPGAQGPLADGLPVWYEALMRTIMPTPAVAQFFQTLLVLAEVAVGLGLLLGLFTWLASLVSIGLALNFFVAGMASWQIFWIIPAAMALLGGAGRVLGLDAWLMPHLFRWAGLTEQPPEETGQGMT